MLCVKCCSVFMFPFVSYPLFFPSPFQPPTTGPAEMKSRLYRDPNKSEGSQDTFKTARIEAPRTTDE
ncbi:hypothetical protein FKM82_029707 [Ascaphus truei]